MPFGRLPAEERDAASSVHLHMVSMRDHVRMFRHSVELFDYATTELARAVTWDEQRRCEAWQKIAGDHCAVGIYHFGHAVRNIFGTPNGKRKCALDATPTLRRLIGNASDQTFLIGSLGDFWSARNGATHVEENMNIVDIDSHRVSGVFIHSQIDGNNIWYTVKGGRHKIELSAATTDCMLVIMQSVFSRIATAIADLHVASLHSS